jgi:hypothetical protein
MPVAVPPPQADTTNRPEPRPEPGPEPKPQTLPQFKAARVKPATGASLRLGNGQVDLLNGASLSTMHALGGARQKPANLAPADPFGARFTGNGD